MWRPPESLAQLFWASVQLRLKDTEGCERAAGQASFCWLAALQRAVAPCCYAMDVETADSQVIGIGRTCAT